MIKAQYRRKKKKAPKQANDWMSFWVPREWKKWLADQAELKQTSASELCRQAVLDKIRRENPSLAKSYEEEPANG